MAAKVTTEEILEHLRHIDGDGIRDTLEIADSFGAKTAPAAAASFKPPAGRPRWISPRLKRLSTACAVAAAVTTAIVSASSTGRAAMLGVDITPGKPPNPHLEE